MGYCFDIDGLGIYQPAAKDRLYDSAVQGEFSTLYLRVEGTKVGPLVWYPAIHWYVEYGIDMHDMRVADMLVW